MRPRTCTWRAPPPRRESGAASALPCPALPQRGPEGEAAAPGRYRRGGSSGVVVVAGEWGSAPGPASPRVRGGGSAPAERGARPSWPRLRSAVGRLSQWRARKVKRMRRNRAVFPVLFKGCGDGSSHYLDEIRSASLGQAICSF